MSEVQESSLMIAGPRRRGRPRVDDPQERVSTRIPAGTYDLLVKAANRSEQSVSSLVRDILMAQSFLSKRAPR